MSQLAFYFDSSKCTGCKTCQVACKENHHLAVDNLYRRVYEYVGGSWEPNPETGWYSQKGIFAYHVSSACNHCQNPACVENCPTGAMQKDPETGIVWTDHELCIGCKSCQMVCPYDAPTLDTENLYMLKCDMCRDRVAQDKRPYCVQACPMRAMDFGDRDELIAKYGEGNINIEPFPEAFTGPSTIVKPHPSAQASGTGTGMISNLPEEL